MTEYYVIRDKNTGLYFRGKGANRWGKHYNQATIYRVKGTAEHSIKDVAWRGEQAEIVPIQIYENTADATDNNVGSKWIPVTERLPDKDGKFLVHRIICGGVSTMSVVGFAHNGKKVHAYDLRNHKKVWYEYDSEVGYYPLTTVTHWMPLPQPPKGE